MTKQFQIYKCQECETLIEVQHPGEEGFAHCGKPMTLQIENTVDASLEKHVPVIEKTAKGIKVKIGSVPHPMEDVHYIMWIQVIVDGRSFRKYLKPGMAPEAEFEISGDNILAREYCNLHGLWKS